MLSLSRVVLLVPVVIMILRPGSENRVAAVVIMLLAASTDFFDGLLARALNQVTDFGKILDPVADKICVITASLALVAAGDVPVWFALLVLLRDVAILIGSTVIISRRRIVVQSVWTGKLTVTFIAAYLVLATLKVGVLQQITSIFLYLSTFAVFVSFAVYVNIFRKDMMQGANT